MHAQPFRPFDLVLFDGTRCTVRHPDYLSIPRVRRPRAVIYYWVVNDTGGDDYEYQTRYLDLNLILEVDVPSEETFQRARPPGAQPPTS
ncbi:MAG TPA: hypothetical protein VKA15_24925 [Isosphaeraceae bacterium]|nr:hypothetical protein [Isosphaeraceae bacterium]